MSLHVHSNSGDTCALLGKIYAFSCVVFMEGVPLSVLAWCLAYRREHTTTCSLPLCWLMRLALHLLLVLYFFLKASFHLLIPTELGSLP